MNVLKKIIHFFVNEIRTIVKSIHSSYRNAPPEMRQGVRRVLLGALGVVILFIIWQKGRDYYDQKQREADLARGPMVKVAVAEESPAARTVQVLGEAKPYAQVTLYAKVSGYLKDMKVDKGDVVKKGQILAVIDSPETDHAYEAALSDAKNKKSIMQRTDKLLERDLVSAQEAETARSESEIASAHLDAQQNLKSYEVLRAPFDGTVTARFADPGALVQNAANSQSSSLPIIALSQVNELRVYVYLDQRDAMSVSKGTPARISLTERPDIIVSGHVERVTGALDEKTRMLLAEIDLDNKKSEIVAGSLVQVSLDLRSEPGIKIPSEALVLREGKTVVPVVDRNQEINYTEVQVIDNDGKFVKVRTGLAAGQIIALNLGNSVPAHGKVRPQDMPAAAPTPAAGTDASGKKTAERE